MTAVAKRESVRIFIKQQGTSNGDSKEGVRGLQPTSLSTEQRAKPQHVAPHCTQIVFWRFHSLHRCQRREKGRKGDGGRRGKGGEGNSMQTGCRRMRRPLSDDLFAFVSVGLIAADLRALSGSGWFNFASPLSVP